MNDLFMSVLLSLFTAIPSILVFVACCYYIAKQSKIDAVLLFIGSGISLVLTLFFSIMPALGGLGYISVTDMTKYYSILGVVNFISAGCFGVGLCILIYNTVNANKTYGNQFPPSNA